MIYETFVLILFRWFVWLLEWNDTDAMGCNAAAKSKIREGLKCQV